MERFQSFDLLATLVAVVSADASVRFSNAALEDSLGISRRTLERRIRNWRAPLMWI